MVGFSSSAMGYSLRFLVAKNGRVQKISAAKLNCVHFDGERWPEVAGQELKLMELALEVDRTRILRVLRVLPYRAQYRCRRPSAPRRVAERAQADGARPRLLHLEVDERRARDRATRGRRELLLGAD